MAQSTSLLKLLECQICTEIFNETIRKPKMLPCQHTICLHCIRQLGRNDFRESYSGDLVSVHTVVKCPTCNAEHDAPENEIDTFPNNITMISFLSVAPPDEDIQHSRPMSPRNDGDIKQCLEERVQRLRDKIAETQVSYIKKVSTWEKEVADAKEIVSTHCENFRQAIDKREATLVKQLDQYSDRRQASYHTANAEFNRQLLAMSKFCDKVETQLKRASERQTTQNLDKCLEMMETLESSDGIDQDATDGSKWSAKFNPDRRDTVHASIAMFGQLVLQEPSSASTKKKAVASGDRNRKTRRVYTRDFLLEMQSSCFTQKPPALVNFPEITPVQPDVSAFMEMNVLMLEKHPLTMNLINIYHKPQSVRRQDPSEGNPYLHDVRVHSNNAGLSSGNVDIFGHVTHADRNLDEPEWSPPRLFLGGKATNSGRPPYLDDEF